PRDHSKLMTLNRAKQSIGHQHFFDLADLLTDQDVLVFNHSRVIPARLQFELYGKSAEILLLKPLADGRWETLVRPGKYFKKDTSLKINDQLTIHVDDLTPFGERVIRFECE